MSEAPPTPAPPVSPDDAPGAALEEAVGLALRVLQAITVALLISFLASGVFTVESNEVAFLRRAGILDETPLGAGLHWRWQVVDEVVRIKKTRPELVIETFDLRATKAALGGEETRQRPGIDPEHDGALLSGDGSLVHVKLGLRTAPRAPYLRSEQTFLASQSERALRVLAERAALRAAAGRSVEDLLGAGKGDFLAEVQGRTQAAIDRLEAGLEVKGVDLAGDLRPSPQVREAFAQVTAATQRIDRLRSEAGSAANQLENAGIVRAAQIEGEARARAAAIRAESASLVKEFEALLPEHRRDPRGLRQRLLARALADSLSQVGESFRVGSGELRIKLERDTRSKRAALQREARERLGIDGK